MSAEVYIASVFDAPIPIAETTCIVEMNTFPCNCR